MKLSTIDKITFQGFLGLKSQRQRFMSVVEMKILSMLPKRFRKAIFHGENALCPVCDSHISQYRAFAQMPHVRCPVCASMRWHRLAWVFLENCTDFFDGKPKKMLHIAPAAPLESKLKQVDNLDYVTGDLYDPKVMVKIDITNIPFDDRSFDIVFCSHVLEHVPEDRLALSEFFRVLKSGGWGIFMVPIKMKQLTDEDFSITDPKEREKRFGQHDHVRFYGRDFEDRIKEAGFKVTPVKGSDLLEKDRLDRLGIREKEVLFYCQKS